MVTTHTTAKAIQGRHYDFDECPCSGPYQLTGISMMDNLGIVWADSEQQAVDYGQARGIDCYHAIAVDSNDVVGIQCMIAKAQ